MVTTQPYPFIRSQPHLFGCMRRRRRWGARAEAWRRGADGTCTEKGAAVTAAVASGRSGSGSTTMRRSNGGRARVVAVDDPSVWRQAANPVASRHAGCVSGGGGLMMAVRQWSQRLQVGNDARHLLHSGKLSSARRRSPPSSAPLSPRARHHHSSSAPLTSARVLPPPALCTPTSSSSAQGAASSLSVRAGLHLLPRACWRPSSSTRAAAAWLATTIAVECGFCFFCIHKLHVFLCYPIFLIFYLYF